MGLGVYGFRVYGLRVYGLRGLWACGFGLRV